MIMDTLLYQLQCVLLWYLYKDFDENIYPFSMIEITYICILTIERYEQYIVYSKADRGGGDGSLCPYDLQNDPSPIKCS